MAYEDRGGDGFPLVMLHRIARFPRDVYELLDHLGLQRTDVLGWSMGVSVWWSFIDQYGTDQIRRFIAADQPSAVAAVPWTTADQQAESGAIFDVAALPTLGEALAGTGCIEVRNGFVRGMSSGEATDPEVLALFVIAELDTVPLHVGVPLLFDHCAQDWRDVLPRIDVPTLVIGCDGNHVDPSSQRFIAQQIPNASLHVFSAEVASSHLPLPGESGRVQRTGGTVPRPSMKTKTWRTCCAATTATPSTMGPPTDRSATSGMCSSRSRPRQTRHRSLSGITGRSGVDQVHGQDARLRKRVAQTSGGKGGNAIF